MHFKEPFSKRLGYSIAEATIAIAILAMTSLFAVKSYKNSIYAGQLSRNWVASTEAVEMLESYVDLRMKAFLEGPVIDCQFAGTKFTSTMTDLESEVGGLSIMLSDGTNLATYPSGTPSLHVNAQSSCTGSQTHMTGVDYRGKSSFDFCLTFRKFGEDSDTFAAIEPAFAQVRVHLQNLETVSPVACENYADNTNNPARTAVVEYTLFWMHSAKKQNVFRKRRGTFYVSSRP